MNTIERIFDLMSKNDITPAQLSQKLDINSSRFTQWKKGLQNPSAEAIVKIALYFNVSTDYLHCLTDDPMPLNKKETPDIANMAEALNVFLREKLGRKPTNKDIGLADKIFDTFAQGFEISEKK